MQVVILCGGQGVRLWPYTKRVPKPLITIGGRPILYHVMKAYDRFGFRDFVLCLGYKGELIRRYFKHDVNGWNIEFADTGLETPTGERIRRVKQLINEEQFFATYADGLADVDLKALREFHGRTGRLATITTVRPPSPFGVASIGNDGDVLQFQEKPRMDDWVNGGFFIFSAGVFDQIQPEEVLERQVFERLVRMGQLKAFRHEGFWRCVDTYKDAMDLNELAQRRELPWEPPLERGIARTDVTA